MMRSAFWRAFALTMVVALVSPVLILQDAEATLSESAHSAMAGSILIPTTAEFDAFPHKALDHKVLVEGTTGMSNWPNGGDINNDHGQVKLVTGIGDDWALQFQANNRAFGARLAEYAWHGTASYRPFTINFNGLVGDSINFLDYRGGDSSFDAFENSRFDIDLVKRGGGGGGWSVGLFNGAQNFVDKQADPTNPGPELKNYNGIIGGRFSWGNGGGVDLAAELSFENHNNETETGTGAVESQDGSTFGITAFGLWRPGPNPTDWNFYAGVNFASGSVKQQYGTPGTDPLEDESHSVLAIELGAGKLVMDEPDGQVSAEVFLDLISGSRDEEGASAKGEAAALALPGANVGFWHVIGGPFRIMGGAHMNFRGKAVAEDNDQGQRVDERGLGELDFRYTLGLGLDLADDKVAVDVEFHPEGIPKLMSFGNDDNLFMVASVQVDLP